MAHPVKSRRILWFGRSRAVPASCGSADLTWKALILWKARILWFGDLPSSARILWFGRSHVKRPHPIKGPHPVVWLISHEMPHPVISARLASCGLAHFPLVWLISRAVPHPMVRPISRERPASYERPASCGLTDFPWNAASCYFGKARILWFGPFPVQCPHSLVRHLTPWNADLKFPTLWFGPLSWNTPLCDLALCRNMHHPVIWPSLVKWPTLWFGSLPWNVPRCDLALCREMPYPVILISAVKCPTL